MYLSNASGSWAVELVATDSAFHSTSIAVDASGKAHVAYYHFASDLEYATNASGSWVSTTIDSDGDVGRACEIAVDSQGFLHIVYQDRTIGTQAKYASNKTGAWDSYILKSAKSGDMAIAIDSTDKIHVTFPGGNGVIYMTNR